MNREFHNSVHWGEQLNVDWKLNYCLESNWSIIMLSDIIWLTLIYKGWIAVIQLFGSYHVGLVPTTSQVQSCKKKKDNARCLITKTITDAITSAYCWKGRCFIFSVVKDSSIPRHQLRVERPFVSLWMHSVFVRCCRSSIDYGKCWIPKKFSENRNDAGFEMLLRGFHVAWKCTVNVYGPSNPILCWIR